MKKAYIIECPKCHAHRINRKKKKCQVCGQVLLYRGDYFFPGDNAFHWMGQSRGWVRVSKLLKPQKSVPNLSPELKSPETKPNE